jgi:hypothetical protein
MSTVTYRYENSLQRKVDGTSHTMKESIIDGEKGISFSFTKKMGEKDFYKVIVKEVEADKFLVTERMDDKKNDNVTKETEMNAADLMKMLKENKDLKFVLDYMTKDRKKQKGGAKKGSKKAAKKGSKKGSKKAAKKGSKKGSKKAAKKGSKKGSKKAARKGSKKGSKKAAKKGSKKGSKKAAKKTDVELASTGSKKKSKKGSKKGSKKRSSKKSA